MAVYYPDRLLTDGDILDAVYDFLAVHVRPALDPSHIVRGWQNRAALPADTSDYAVMSVVGTTRVGTNVVTDLKTDDDTETVAELRRADIQIDFCSEGAEASQRASVLEVLARSDVAVSFFKNYGLSCLYAENVACVDYQDGSEQMIHRYTTTLHLSGWFVVSVVLQHATAVSPYVELVSMHHPIRR